MLIACFQIQAATGLIRFAHVMLAVLNGHTHPESDWVYVGSKVNATTGSRRTETVQYHLGRNHEVAGWLGVFGPDGY